MQRDFLRAHGCDEMQGYFHSRPTGPEECAAHFAAPARATPQS